MGFLDGILGNSADGDNHESPIGALGAVGQKYTDPLSWIFGDKWTNLVSKKIPELTNSGLSTVMKPFEAVDKTINPIRRIPIVDKVGDYVAQKPGDAIGTAIGAFFAAPAIGAAFGAGGAGAGAGAAGAAGTGAGVGSAAGAAGITGGSAGLLGGGGGVALGSTAGLTGTFSPLLGGIAGGSAGLLGGGGGTALGGSSGGIGGLSNQQIASLIYQAQQQQQRLMQQQNQVPQSGLLQG